MNAIYFAIGGAMFGVSAPMVLWWNGTAQPSNWFWLVSGVFGGLSGAFFVLAMRMTTPETCARTLTPRERKVVKLLMVPTIVGASMLFIGGGTLPRQDELENSWPIILILVGSVTLLFPILIGGTMSLIVQLSSHRNAAEPSHAAKDAN